MPINGGSLKSWKSCLGSGFFSKILLGDSPQGKLLTQRQGLMAVSERAQMLAEGLEAMKRAATSGYRPPG
jgi:hypothetical protein